MLQQGAATRVTSLMYLVPPGAALLAWLLFDEPVGALVWLGMGLSALGVFWVVRKA
jgi:drug/metabolite transporter (DMT)-like permease